MLSESSTTIIKCEGTVSRRVETSTGSTSMMATASKVSMRRPIKSVRFARDSSRCSQPCNFQSKANRASASQDQDDGDGPSRQRGELEMRIAPRDDAG